MIVIVIAFVSVMLGDVQGIRRGFLRFVGILARDEAAFPTLKIWDDATHILQMVLSFPPSPPHFQRQWDSSSALRRLLLLSSFVLSFPSLAFLLDSIHISAIESPT